MMNHMLTLMGGAAGSWLGWMMGRAAGMGLAFFLSLIGLGIGHYLARRFVQENLL